MTTDAASAERNGAAAALPRPRRQPPDHRFGFCFCFCFCPRRPFPARSSRRSTVPRRTPRSPRRTCPSPRRSHPRTRAAPPHVKVLVKIFDEPGRTARCEGPPPRLSSPPPPAIGPWRPRARTSRRGNDTPTVRSGDRPRTQNPPPCRRFALSSGRTKRNTPLSCSRFAPRGKARRRPRGGPRRVAGVDSSSRSARWRLAPIASPARGCLRRKARRRRRRSRHLALRRPSAAGWPSTSGTATVLPSAATHGGQNSAGALDPGYRAHPVAAVVVGRPGAGYRGAALRHRRQLMQRVPRGSRTAAIGTTAPRGRPSSPRVRPPVADPRRSSLPRTPRSGGRHVSSAWEIF